MKLSSSRGAFAPKDIIIRSLYFSHFLCISNSLGFLRNFCSKPRQVDHFAGNRKTESLKSGSECAGSVPYRADYQHLQESISIVSLLTPELLSLLAISSHTCNNILSWEGNDFQN